MTSPTIGTAPYGDQRFGTLPEDFAQSLELRYARAQQEAQTQVEQAKAKYTEQLQQRQSQFSQHLAQAQADFADWQGSLSDQLAQAEQALSQNRMRLDNPNTAPRMLQTQARVVQPPQWSNYLPWNTERGNQAGYQTARQSPQVMGDGGQVMSAPPALPRYATGSLIGSGGDTGPGTVVGLGSGFTAMQTAPGVWTIYDNGVVRGTFRGTREELQAIPLGQQSQYAIPASQFAGPAAQPTTGASRPAAAAAPAAAPAVPQTAPAVPQQTAAAPQMRRLPPAYAPPPGPNSPNTNTYQRGPYTVVQYGDPTYGPMSAYYDGAGRLVGATPDGPQGAVLPYNSATLPDSAGSIGQQVSAKAADPSLPGVQSPNPPSIGGQPGPGNPGPTDAPYGAHWDAASGRWITHEGPGRLNFQTGAWEPAPPPPPGGRPTDAQIAAAAPPPPPGGTPEQYQFRVPTNGAWGEGFYASPGVAPPAIPGVPAETAQEKAERLRRERETRPGVNPRDETGAGQGAPYKTGGKVSPPKVPGKAEGGQVRATAYLTPEQQRRIGLPLIDEFDPGMARSAQAEQPKGKARGGLQGSPPPVPGTANAVVGEEVMPGGGHRQELVIDQRAIDAGWVKLAEGETPAAIIPGSLVEPIHVNDRLAIINRKAIPRQQAAAVSRAPAVPGRKSGGKVGTKR